MHGYRPNWIKPKFSNPTNINNIVSTTVFDDSLSNRDSDQPVEKVEDKILLTKKQQLSLLALLQQSDSSHQTNQITVNSSGTVSLHNANAINPSDMYHWLLDIGATDHVCFDLTLFHTYKRITPIIVHLPNHHTVQAHFSGTILFASDFYLSNV